MHLLMSNIGYALPIGARDGVVFPVINESKLLLISVVARVGSVMIAGTIHSPGHSSVDVWKASSSPSVFQSSKICEAVGSPSSLNSLIYRFLQPLRRVLAPADS